LSEVDQIMQMMCSGSGQAFPVSADEDNYVSRTESKENQLLPNFVTSVSQGPCISFLSQGGVSNIGIGYSRLPSPLWGGGVMWDPPGTRQQAAAGGDEDEDEDDGNIGSQACRNSNFCYTSESNPQIDHLGPSFKEPLAHSDISGRCSISTDVASDHKLRKVQDLVEVSHEVGTLEEFVSLSSSSTHPAVSSDSKLGISLCHSHQLAESVTNLNYTLPAQQQQHLNALELSAHQQPIQQPHQFISSRSSSNHRFQYHQDVQSLENAHVHTLQEVAQQRCRSTVANNRNFSNCTETLDDATQAVIETPSGCSTLLGSSGLQDSNPPEDSSCNHHDHLGHTLSLNSFQNHQKFAERFVNNPCSAFDRPLPNHHQHRHQQAPDFKISDMTRLLLPSTAANYNSGDHHSTSSASGSPSNNIPFSLHEHWELNQVAVGSNPHEYPDHHHNIPPDCHHSCNRVDDQVEFIIKPDNLDPGSLAVGRVKKVIPGLCNVTWRELGSKDMVMASSNFAAPPDPTGTDQVLMMNVACNMDHPVLESTHHHVTNKLAEQHCHSLGFLQQVMAQCCNQDAYCTSGVH
jgi:hypothetical protein